MRGDERIDGAGPEWATYSGNDGVCGNTYNLYDIPRTTFNSLPYGYLHECRIRYILVTRGMYPPVIGADPTRPSVPAGTNPREKRLRPSPVAFHPILAGTLTWGER